MNRSLGAAIFTLLLSTASIGIARDGTGVKPDCLCANPKHFDGKIVMITSQVFLTRESLNLIEKSNQTCGIDLSISATALKNPSVDDFVKRAYARPIKFGWIDLVGTFEGKFKINADDGSRVLFLDKVVNLKRAADQ